MWLTPGTLPSVSRPLGLEARLGAFPGVPPLLFKWGSTPPPHLTPRCLSTARAPGPWLLREEEGGAEIRKPGDLGALRAPGGRGSATEHLFILPAHSSCHLLGGTDRYPGAGFVRVSLSQTPLGGLGKPPPSS